MKHRVMPLAQCALLIGGVLFTLSIAQTPTLDPAQTVNTATGEMSFGLPLGTVNGINGRNFPISLNYHAGVSPFSEAGPEGLGFSVDAGCIVRQPILVPDNNDSSVTWDNQDCDETGWKQVVSTICQVVGFIVGLILLCLPGGQPLGTALTIASLTITAVSMVVSLVVFSPADYRAGGTHTPVYDYKGSYGYGYFKKGEYRDLPDVYFVNTPYINGQFVWVGDRQNGHFVLKSSGGSIEPGASTTIITYDQNCEVFRIQLADGTVLLFEDTDQQKQWISSHGFAHGNDVDCEITSAVYGFRKIATQWHLTKVLFPDFKGNETSPEIRSSGSWIEFKYWVCTSPTGSQREGINSWKSGFYFPGETRDNAYYSSSMQSSDQYSSVCGTTFYQTCYLKKVVTPNQSAEFFYKSDRLDAFRESVKYHQDGDADQHDYVSMVLMPRLDRIEFKSNSGTVLSTAQLNTSYYLRPNTYQALESAYPNPGWEELDQQGNPVGPLKTADYYCYFDDNGNFTQSGAGAPSPSFNDGKKSLTLNSVTIFDKGNTNTSTVGFEYKNTGSSATLFNPALGLHVGSCPRGDNRGYHAGCVIEDRDLWGFYLPSLYPSSGNNFNTSGDKVRMTKSDGFPWADVWSVKKVNLPNGASIEWKFESNRFDRTNGIAVEGPDHGPKYGDGIRVKEVIADDGITGKPLVTSYFYTAQNGVFNETSGGCSGYASAEPYNNISSDEYRSNPVTRGGLYTPAKVAYEKVQVVNNYQTTVPYAPQGYLVYDFTHAGDSTVPGYYPNLGHYGDIDYSWKRGLVRIVSQYDKNGVLKQKKEDEYDFVEYQTVYTDSSDKMPVDAMMNNIITARQQNTVGWTKLKKSIVTVDGVASVKEYKYAPEAQFAPDKIETILRDIRQLPQYGLILGGGSGKGIKIATAVTKMYGDTNKYDLLVAAGNSIPGAQSDSLYFFLVTDIDFTTTCPYYNYNGMESVGFITIPGSLILTGIDFAKIPGAGDENKEDLIVELVDAGSNPQNYFYFYIFNDNDIYPFQNLQQTISYWANQSADNYLCRTTGSNQSQLTEINNQGDYRDVLSVSRVCSLDDNPKPDLIYFCSHKEYTANKPSKKLYALRNFSTNSNGGHKNICFDDQDNCSNSSSPLIYTSDDNVTALQTSLFDVTYLGSFCKSIQSYSNNDLVIAKGHLFSGPVSDGVPGLNGYQVFTALLRNVRINSSLKIVYDQADQLHTYSFFDDWYQSLSTYSAEGMDLFSLDFPESNNKDSLFCTAVNARSISMWGVNQHYTELTCFCFNHNKTQYSDYDGQPNENWETNSDGVKRITVPTPAYWRYTALDTVNHMITPVCQNTRFKDTISPDKAISSQATTWYFDSIMPGTIGGISHEWWTGLSPFLPEVSDLTSNQRFIAGTPSGADVLTSFDCPVDWGNGYGQRVRGFLIPPDTGYYHFSLCSDDYSELWLSSDENPAHKGTTPLLSFNSWATHLNWNGGAKTSTPVYLEAGRYYYVEALQKEAYGGDNLSVGWALASTTNPNAPYVAPSGPIPGSCLATARPAGVWHQKDSYVWKTAMNRLTGLASTSLPNFNFSTPSASDSAWKFTGGVTLFSPNSNPVEQVNALNFSNVSVYGTAANQPVGAISGANFYESGAFTCDYDFNEPPNISGYFNYFDKANGWEKDVYGTIIDGSAGPVHYGQKSLQIVNGEGAMRNFKIRPNTRYALSAWVNVMSGTTGNGFRLSAELHRGAPPTDPWPVRSTNLPSLIQTITSDEIAPTGGQWKLVKVAIPGQDSTTGNEELWVRVTIGENGKTFTAYVDNIRFAPVKAMVITSYYDTLWQAAILEVGANNTPGQKVVYDGYGRPSKWFKINKNNPDSATLIKENRYHLMPELFFDDFEGAKSTLVNSDTSYSYGTGYNSAHSAVVPITSGTATFSLPDAIAAQLAGESGTLSWNYNVPSGSYSGVVLYQVGVSSHIIDTFTLTGAGKWEYISVPFDFSTVSQINKIWVQVFSSTPNDMLIDNVRILKVSMLTSGLIADTSKWYKIVSKVDPNYCMNISRELSGGIWQQKQLINVWQYLNASKQLWKFIDVGSGYYAIVSRGGTQVGWFGFDDPHGVIDDTTHVRIWTAPTDYFQKWLVIGDNQGWQKIQCWANNNVVINLNNGNAVNGEALKMRQYTGGDNQKWKFVEVPQFTPDTSKWYKMVSKVDTNSCMNISSALSGGIWQQQQIVNVSQYLNASRQLWKFQKVDSVYYTIVSRGGTQVGWFGFDDPHGVIDDTTHVRIWTAPTTTNQKWLLIGDEQGYQKVACWKSNDTVIANMSGSAKLQPDNNTDDKKWRILEVPQFIPDTSKWYKIVSKVDTNNCMNISSALSGDIWQQKQLINVSQYLNACNQLWKFQKVDSVYYTIVSRGGTQGGWFGIDDPYGVIDDTTHMKIWTAPTGNFQKWLLIGDEQGYQKVACWKNNDTVIANISGSAILHPDNNTDDKKWRIVEVPQFIPDTSKWYKIVSKSNPNKCLAVNGSCGNSQPLRIEDYKYRDTIYQLWKFRKVDTYTEYYCIASLCSGSAYGIGIDNPFGDTISGTQLGTYATTTSNQEWLLIGDSQGYQKVACYKNNCYVMDLNSGNAILNRDANTDSQKWLIVLP
ncbi:MAG: PA14 domain-containing protein [Chitinispirillaceae bacterium]|jgi:DNA-binding transcriptional regulator YdaS (Cro superfamily)